MMKNSVFSGQAEPVILCSLALSIIGLHESRKLCDLLDSCKKQIAHEILQFNRRSRRHEGTSSDYFKAEVDRRKSSLASIQGVIDQHSTSSRANESRIRSLLDAVDSDMLRPDEALSGSETAVEISMGILHDQDHGSVVADALLLNLEFHQMMTTAT
jgi:hypothetical protein